MIFHFLILRLTNQLSIDIGNNMDKGKPSTFLNASKAEGSGSSQKSYDSKFISESIAKKAHEQFVKIMETYKTLPGGHPLVKPAKCQCVEGKLLANIRGRMEQMKKKNQNMN